MDSEQIELHRQLRIHANRKTTEPLEPNMNLKYARESVDHRIAQIPDKTLRDRIQARVNEERMYFPLFTTVPKWLLERVEKLQVTNGESPGSDQHANAVVAIRSVLKGHSSFEKKVAAIRKIVGDIDVEN